MMEEISSSDAARALGSIKTPHKAATSRKNGKKGGRPPGVPMSEEHKAAIRAARQRQEEERRLAIGIIENAPVPKRPRGRPKKEPVQNG